jgi:endonuclease YncB( thermonuclease family)
MAALQPSRRIEADNFGGRIDAEVVLARDGTNLSDWMLTNGWADLRKRW